MNESDLVPTKIPGLKVCISSADVSYAYSCGEGLYDWLLARALLARKAFLGAGYRDNDILIEMPRGMERGVRLSEEWDRREDAWNDSMDSIGDVFVAIRDRPENCCAPLAQMVAGSEPSGRMTKIIVLIPSLEEIAAGWEPEE